MANRSSRLLRVGFVTFLASFLVALAVTPALARYVYQNGWVWENGSGKCLEERAEVSHGTGTGYTKADVHSVKEYGPPQFQVDCAADWVMPINYLRVKNVLYKYSGSWYVCRDQSYKYNSVKDAFVLKATYWNVPCGSGYYANNGRGHMVDPNGRVDFARMPNRIGVVDSQGNFVGYVKSADLYDMNAPGPPDGQLPTQDAPAPVRNARGQLVGQLVPDRGFVPIEE
jgi:hypothetical protein